ncbi:ARM repeat-containing protein [Rickenella mellea]|uniref:ARM repeat-containing protein n=1 Tax=Rickenella mellea TaxID=50990 RepID=A0A4Y7QGF6_9AGAM|nr:ARM repeat-containing protein [Rickenella mellea]
MSQPSKEKEDEDLSRRTRRAALKRQNIELGGEEPTKALDSSLKRHTALIKRMRQSIGTDNHDQIMKDINSLTLEKYVDEIAGAVLEGVGRCKTEKDVWSAVEVISSLHRRFPSTFTPALTALLAPALAPTPRAQLSALTPEQREKEDATRVSRQRPVLRVCSELALVGIIRDAPGKSGGDWVMKTLKDLLSNDPSLSSLPLLSAFLKGYARPFLGLSPPAHKQQISESSEPGSLAASLSSSTADPNSASPHIPTHPAIIESEELVEKEVRDKFRRMCEQYFDSVAKKLVIEHKRLQEQDRRNHEAYIRSGEIFEDRQQQYEKMTKGYERLLGSCQTLSELLYLPMPELPTQSQKADSILVSSGTGQGDAQEDIYTTGGKWEDEEERRFFEDLQDIRDFVPNTFLGIDEKGGEDGAEKDKETAKEDEKDKERLEQEEARKLEEELNKLKMNEDTGVLVNGTAKHGDNQIAEDDEDDAPTPIPTPPKSPTPPLTPTLAPQGPSQLLTSLLTRLPDATNRSLIDQVAVEFAFLNSKAARKRLVKFLTQVPKNRTDLLPHYSRLVATLNKYMPDIAVELIASLEEEFRYLQRKKNVVKELSEVRQKNIAFLSNLTKFKVVPSHLILHMFKVCLDDFSGVNIDNMALLLEGCGRFLLRSDETRERFGTMIELMRRKQNMQHLDQRQLLVLENAYYQCNPPERGPREEKQRTPMELFIRHLVYDVLSKKTIDKVLRMIRKLDWDDPQVVHSLRVVFTKAWKIKYSNISLLAMLAYDLQRYHPAFTVDIVDQVLEDIRRGLETNVYKANQQRVATVKYLGELYIYRLISSSIIFDTLWSLVTFGHPQGKPLPNQPCPIDMADDFFRVRLVCVLLDTCGMCFDHGVQKKKLDNFLLFFQLYTFTKIDLPMDVEFMLSDSLEALRPNLVKFKTFEDAAFAVDDMFDAAMQKTVGSDGEGDDGEDSGDDSDRERDDDAEEEEEDDEEVTAPDSPTDDRAPSPDTLVVLSTPENLGPSEEDDSEFAKELAKMVTDYGAESRKVDKRTAQALWDSNVLPTNLRKKKAEDSDDEDEEDDGPTSEGQDIMIFTVLTKKGNKQQAKKLAVPADSTLAVHTRSAQLQDRVEQQHLKRLVLDYEQREEVEELKALDARSRNGPIRIRYVG